VVYEPMPLACAILDENMQLNDLSVDRRARALGTKPATRQFLAQPNILSSSWIPRDGGQMIEIAVDHVADVLAETRANVLILDAEGAEVEIIEGCPLEQIDKVVVEMHGNLVGPEAIARISDRLVAHGLIPYDELCRGRVITFLRKARA
jgi:FkbM family methyltransferase